MLNINGVSHALNPIELGRTDTVQRVLQKSSERIAKVNTLMPVPARFQMVPICAATAGFHWTLPGGDRRLGRKSFLGQSPRGHCSSSLRMLIEIRSTMFLVTLRRLRS